jgi:hypothetical protein
MVSILSQMFARFAHAIAPPRAAIGTPVTAVQEFPRRKTAARFARRTTDPRSFWFLAQILGHFAHDVSAQRAAVGTRQTSVRALLKMNIR